MAASDLRLRQQQVLKLLQLVRNQDEPGFRKLCTFGIENLINYGDINTGETALQLAAAENSELIVGILLELGADPNIQDVNGRTAAMRAATYGHLQSLKCLVKNGADLTSRDEYGRNILFYCIEPTERHKECIHISLQNGSNINNIGSDGLSLCMVAIASHLPEMLALLLSLGADPNIQMTEKPKQTALHQAASLNALECCKLLLQAGADTNIVDAESKNPGHYAVSAGYLDILHSLAGYRLNFTSICHGKNTMLHLAAKHGHAEICKFLAQRGCPSLEKNREGKNARTIAKDLDLKDVLKECKKAERMKFSKPGMQDWSIKLYDWMISHEYQLIEEFYLVDPLTNEKRRGKVANESFKVILQSLDAPVDDDNFKNLIKGHDPKRSGEIDYNLFLSGKKFIHKTFAFCKKPVKKKEKRGGRKGKGRTKKTKVNMPICIREEEGRDKRGMAPLDYIPKFQVVQETSRFDRDNPPLHPIQDDSPWYLNAPDPYFVGITTATGLGDLDTIRAAFLRGTDVNQVDKYFKTPLMAACLQGNFDMVQFLIKSRADIHACDNFKWTPLHFACHCGHLDIVQSLLEAGADIEAKAFSGGTPLMRAIESCKQDVVQLLINKGAKVYSENKRGDKPIDVALAYSNGDVIKIIQKRMDEVPPPDPKKRGGKKSSKSQKKKKIEGVVDMKDDGERKVSKEISGEDDFKFQTSAQLRASQLARSAMRNESIVFNPKKIWHPEATTRELLIAREMRRQRFGFEVDFPSYLRPFQENVKKKTEELPAVEET